MKSFGLGAFALRGCVALALLAGCGAPQPIDAPGATAIAPDTRSKVRGCGQTLRVAIFVYVSNPGNDTVTVYAISES